MIIKSADGESIVNFDNLSLLQVEEKDNKYVIYAYETSSTVVIPLGTYSTKEQAIGIIDEIIETYKGTQQVLTTGSFFEPSSDHVLCATVYQMPPDEEPEEG